MSAFFFIQSATLGIGLALLQRQAQWINRSSPFERIGFSLDRVQGLAHLLQFIRCVAWTSGYLVDLNVVVVSIVPISIQHGRITWLAPRRCRIFLCLLDVGLGKAGLAVRMLA